MRRLGPQLHRTTNTVARPSRCHRPPTPPATGPSTREVLMVTTPSTGPTGRSTMEKVAFARDAVSVCRRQMQSVLPQPGCNHR